MESYLPTRPNSDLHRRLSARKRQPAAMEAQFQVPAVSTERERPRSSSFSAIGQSLSRLLPSNRLERGGTAQPINRKIRTNNSSSPPKGLMEILRIRGRANEREDDGEDMRRTKSWSPKKIARIADERGSESRQPRMLEKSSTLKRISGLHKTAKDDDGTEDFSQYSDRLRSKIRGLDRSMQLNSQYPDVFETAEIKEARAALKRSRQIFEEKKTRRQERSSFRESEDFIGVQGINPRTGYPDPSPATSSSAGDILSGSTHQRLEEHEKIMATASKEYKAALERREVEMKRLGMEREIRRREKKERAENKRAQLKARVRKEGRWKIEGNAWRTVTEPSLSPIVQSIIGTPMQETVTSPYQFPKTLAIADEKMIDRPGARTEDYINPTSALPRTPTRYQARSVGSASHIPLSHRYSSRDIEVTSGTIQQNRLPARFNSLQRNSHRTPIQTNQNLTLPIRRKEVGSAILRRRTSSSGTIIHNIKITQSLPVAIVNSHGSPIATTPPSVSPRLELKTPKDKTLIPALISPAIGEMPFLGAIRVPFESKAPRKYEATVISHQLVLKNQRLAQLPQPDYQKDTFLENHISSTKDFPLVVLKDPISARLPQDTQSPYNLSLLSVSKPANRLTQQKLRNQEQSTITPTTTITGFVGHSHPLGHINSFEDDNEHPVSPLRNVIAASRAVSFHLKETLSGTPNSAFPTSQPDIATSSAQHLPAFSTPTKKPILRPCQLPSAKLENWGLKSILTSTSTSQKRQRFSQQYAASKSIAEAVFVGTSPRRLGKEVKERSTSLVTTNLKAKERSKEAAHGRKIFSAGSADIGYLSKARKGLEGDPELLGKRIEQARSLGGPSIIGLEDGIITWCREIEQKVPISDENPISGREQVPQTLSNKKLKDRQSSPNERLKDTEKPVAKMPLLQNAYRVLTAAVETAWFFVLPVFNPRSNLRRRWGRNELTWQDILLIGAAGIFGGGAFLVMVLLARLLGIGLQIVRVCIKVCKVLSQL